uniref:BACK domain-containing protein n=1 Tax=Mola mola TaxID=94237 RepID=A0A3Q3WHR6_MOLML
MKGKLGTVFNYALDMGECQMVCYECNRDCICARKVTDYCKMDGKAICTHKIILSQFPLFNASEEATSFMVSVPIHTRKVDVTHSSMQCLHWMASRFGVKQLMEDVGRVFSGILPEDTLFQTPVSLYEYAEEARDLVLRENCIRYLAWNFQNLARSPAWTKLPIKLLRVLLTRFDLVVPDEYFLLQALESWVMDRGNSTTLETQVDLLKHSSLYSTHVNMYREKVFNALHFNVLLFSKLQSSPKFNKDDDDFEPRIYTAEPWSTAIDPWKRVPGPRFQLRYCHNRYRTTRSPEGQPITELFSTPLHSSLIFENNKIQWEANLFKSKQDCSNRGLICESFLTARLVPKNQFHQISVIFRKQLLLMYQGKYVCQVQDFKEGISHITVNGTHVVAYPCPADRYTYHFVVRPECV